MHKDYSRSQVLGSIGIALGVVTVVAYPLVWSALLYNKWLVESLHPGLIVDPVNPLFLVVFGIVLIALGLRQLAK